MFCFIVKRFLRCVVILPSSYFRGDFGRITLQQKEKIWTGTFNLQFATIWRAFIQNPTHKDL